MLVIFAVIIGGIATGRLLIGRRLAFVPRLITVIIWALLFLLGVEVGSDPAVVGSLATLGGAALAIFALSVAGSIFAAWLLWRRIRGRAVPADDGEAAADVPVSAWAALCGSLVIVAFFVAGCVVGLFAPFDLAGSRVSAYVLYALMFCVGITLGNDRTLAGRVRRLDPRLALLPVATAVGTLAGAALAAPLLAEWFRLLFVVEHLHRRFPGTRAGHYRLVVQRHARDFHLVGRAARRTLVRAAGRRVDRRCDDFRHDAPDHHAGRRPSLCRGVGLSRLRARFQRPVPGDVLLYRLKPPQTVRTRSAHSGWRRM